MKEFRLHSNTNLTFLKVVRGFGKIALGALLMYVFIDPRWNLPINWGVLLPFSLYLAFLFPGWGVGKQELQIDDSGISLKGVGYHYKRDWSNIQHVEISRSWFPFSEKITITNNLGSTESFGLPFHSQKKLEELTSFLQLIASKKFKTEKA